MRLVQTAKYFGWGQKWKVRLVIWLSARSAYTVSYDRPLCGNQFIAFTGWKWPIYDIARHSDGF
jgi:hypothetical protein